MLHNKNLFACTLNAVLYGHYFFYYFSCHLLVIFPIYEVLFQSSILFLKFTLISFYR